MIVKRGRRDWVVVVVLKGVLSRLSDLEIKRAEDRERKFRFNGATTTTKTI